MTVNFSPLRASYGFSSPGFLVSPTGNLSVSGDITVVGSLAADTLIVNGISLLESEDSSISLSTAITNSSLTSLGRLARLKVSGDVDITDNLDNINISIVDGTVTVLSTSTGSIDNISIGLTTPSDANFNNVNVGQLGNIGQLEIIGSMTVSNTATIASIDSLAIAVNDVTINNIPTELYHATRKDYVDSRISALSIALGA
jgi:hypothetical protein